MWRDSVFHEIDNHRVDCEITHFIYFQLRSLGSRHRSDSRWHYWRCVDMCRWHNTESFSGVSYVRRWCVKLEGMRCCRRSPKWSQNFISLPLCQATLWPWPGSMDSRHRSVEFGKILWIALDMSVELRRSIDQRKIGIIWLPMQRYLIALPIIAN